MFYIEVNKDRKLSGCALTQAGAPRKKWFEAEENRLLLVGVGHPLCAVKNHTGMLHIDAFRYFRVEVAESVNECIFRDARRDLPEAMFSCKRARIVGEILQDDPLLSTESVEAMILGGPRRVRFMAFRFMQDRIGFKAMIPHARKIFSPFVEGRILHQDDYWYLPFLRTLLNMLLSEEEDATLLLNTFRDTRDTWYEHPALSKKLFGAVLPLLDDPEEIRAFVERLYDRRDDVDSSDEDFLRAATKQIAASENGEDMLCRIVQETPVQPLRSAAIHVLRKFTPPPMRLLMRCAVDHPDLSNKAVSWMTATTGDLEAAKDLVTLVKMGNEQQQEAVRSVYSSFRVLVSVPGGDRFAFEVACDTELPIELRMEAIAALDVNEHMETLVQWLTSDTQREEVRCASLAAIAESVRSIDFFEQHALAPYMDDLARVAFVGKARLPLFLKDTVLSHLLVRKNRFGVTWLQRVGVKSTNKAIRCRAVYHITDRQHLLKLAESERVSWVLYVIKRRLHHLSSVE